MGSLVVRTEADRNRALRVIRSSALPFVLTKTRGEKRSNAQNRLLRQWCKDCEAQGDLSAEEWRGYMKLAYGVPILRYSNEAFRQEYDETIRDLPYETKLKLMMEPFDLPITRQMTVAQQRLMLDRIYESFTREGYVLTNPSWAGMEVA